MKDITHLKSLELIDNPQLTLAEQRAELQLKLHINRRLLIYKFTGEQDENHFPRSSTMRFLTQQTTLHLLKKVAFMAIGVKTFKAAQYGFSLWKFVRRRSHQTQ